MALLKFRCKACGKVFDELVSPSALNKVKCPECGGETERAYEGTVSYTHLTLPTILLV